MYSVLLSAKHFKKIKNGDKMDLIAILRIMLLVFIVIIGILLYVNRNAENQGKVRIAFVLIVVMFVAQFLLFK